MANKKINLKLVGLDGNAFAILGAFHKQAKREGWTDKEIGEVLDSAQSGGYGNLLSVLSSHCK